MLHWKEQREEQVPYEILSKNSTSLKQRSIESSAERCPGTGGNSHQTSQWKRIHPDRMIDEQFLRLRYYDKPKSYPFAVEFTTFFKIPVRSSDIWPPLASKSNQKKIYTIAGVCMVCNSVPATAVKFLVTKLIARLRAENK